MCGNFAATNRVPIMSKIIQKKPAAPKTAMAAALDEAGIKKADADQARLDRRDHEFGEGGKPERTDAPVGLSPSSPRSVTQGNVFDMLEEISSQGRITGYRAIANGAICGAVFAANQFLTLNQSEDPADQEKAEDARGRMVEQAELYSYAAQNLLTLALTPFDKPMTLAEAIDFASSNASDQRRNAELPDEVLELLGITKAQLQVIDADEQRKQKIRDAKLREQFRVNSADIAAEVGSFVDVQHASDAVLSRFTAQQHQQLFNKVVRKLQARIGQLLGIRGKYEGAIGEAILISQDAKQADKAYSAFVRANKAELNETADA